jgi:hypothetical protein
MQSVTAVRCGDQRKLRAMRERKHRNALGCISKRSGEMVHSLSLIRHRVNARRTMNDNDEPPSFAPFGRTKISSLNHCCRPLQPAQRHRVMILAGESITGDLMTKVW